MPQSGVRRPPSRRPAAPALLLAEADEAVAIEVIAGLAAEGIKVTECRDGAEALLRAGLERPSMVLLGAPLPVVDAAAVTELLSRFCPSTVVVGVGGHVAEEAVAALDAGAVAAVARPYRLAEILPLLWRVPVPAEGPGERLVVGDIELDEAGMHVHVHGRQLHLPLREFQLLSYLMRHARQVVRRQQILRDLWGGELADTNTLTVHIKRLREKLATGPGSCCTIDTVRGLGYRLECPVRDHAR
ncbi:putative response regulator [Streptomyces longisporoflavus]|uniref:winged helix-turn-helix transcriptional regulator n=1 Tax=Streptomyces longisporoflavus TaxID=28044 RepID=UPI00167E7D16|nr:response regulator transcription factor [Streptomyces longisporoflavus]GGV28752.1 putative response regulator [Streptomyces longisporoflavus]